MSDLSESTLSRSADGRIMEASNKITPRDVYTLSNAGETSVDDTRWETQLIAAIVQNDLHLTEAILCCGTPMTQTILDLIPSELEPMRVLCKKFYPDIWTAVRTGNVKQVRCLVNLWHKVSLTRHGRTLFQFAVDNANPYIITLVGGIEATMDIAHFVLAGDLEKLRAARKNGPYIKRTLKHFGHNCAPVLYFAIIQNNLPLVEELCLYFCVKGDDEMLDDDGEDIPLLFVALQNAVDTAIIEILAAHINRNLQNIWYQGKNILQYSIDLQVPVECFNRLVQLGGGKVLSERDLLNRSVIEYINACENCGKLGEAYISAIQNIVAVWMLQKSADIGWLAVKGFDFTTVLTSVTCSPIIDEAVLADVRFVQQTICNMNYCIDTENFDQFCYLESLQESLDGQWPDMLWYGCLLGTSQTLLHRAVMKNRTNFVDLILIHANIVDIPLDNFGASALSYACAAGEYCEIERKLLCTGFGEYTMDKTGHDCASYRMKRDTPEMRVFLSELLTGYYGVTVLSLPWMDDSSCVPLQYSNFTGDRGQAQAAAGVNEVSVTLEKSGHSGRSSFSGSVSSQKNSWCSVM